MIGKIESGSGIRDACMDGATRMGEKRTPGKKRRRERDSAAKESGKKEREMGVTGGGEDAGMLMQSHDQMVDLRTGGSDATLTLVPRLFFHVLLLCCPPPHRRCINSQIRSTLDASPITLSVHTHTHTHPPGVAGE